MPGPQAKQFSLWVIVVLVGSWLPVLIGATTRAAIGWGLVVVLAVALERLTRSLSPSVLVAGTLLSSALVPSGLVTDSTHYMPFAVTGGALTLRAVLLVRQGDLRRIAPRAVVVTVGLYLAWAALASATSIDHKVSAVYLAGILVVCALAFWAVPAMLSKTADREVLLPTLGAAGVVMALSVYVGSAAGSIQVFGRPIGDYQLADLTLNGRFTSLYFGRSAGIDLAPLEASVLMVVGIVALIAWSTTKIGNRLLMSILGIAFIVPAIVLTLDRTALLTAILSSAVMTILAIAARRTIALSAVVFLVFTVVFTLIFVGIVGAVAVIGDCPPNCATRGALRGGTALSGREYLWRASVDAIKRRPIVGYGPGNDVPALAPYLGNFELRGQSLTSHNTWLRTAVEMGVPGLAMLLAILAAVAALCIKNLHVAIRDPVQVTLIATVCGLFGAMTFETFLLGGVTFTSLILAIALGLLAVPVTTAAESRRATSPAAA